MTRSLLLAVIVALALVIVVGGILIYRQNERIEQTLDERPAGQVYDLNTFQGRAQCFDDRRSLEECSQ